MKETDKTMTNTISITEQNNGKFKLSCDETYIPLGVAETIVNGVLEEVKEKYSDKELLAAVDFFKFEAKHYKRLWIVETILYVLMLILFALKANGVL